MKRRVIIKGGALAAAAAPLALAPGRLYGKPKSVSPADYSEDLKFVLPLSRFGIPTDLLQMSSAVVDLWTDVLSTPTNQSTFAADPAPYLTKFGLDASDTVVNDSNVRLLTALVTPSVQTALNSKNYDSLFSQMTALGAFEPTSANALQTLMEKTIAQQKDSLMAYIATITGENNTQGNTMLAKNFVMEGTMVTPDDLVSLGLVFHDSLAGTNPQLRYAYSNIVAYVTAAVAAFALALAVVAAAVAIPVYAFGDEPAEDGVNKPVFGNLAMSDPNLMQNAERAQRLANLTGDPGIAAHSARQLIQTEITAVIIALSNNGVVPLAPGKEPAAIAALTQYACKALGLATPQAA